MLGHFLAMSLGASLVVSVADKVPEFDVTASCKEVAGFGLALAHNPEHCIKDENTARAELQQKWSTYPAAERSRCVAETMIGSPSYVDILTCLEMTKEAEALNAPLIGASKKKRSAK